jgi:hypothetical protein
MACSDTPGREQTVMISAINTKETVLEEFKAGVVRSMKQYNAGLVKTFDNADDFLADLHSPE